MKKQKIDEKKMNIFFGIHQTLGDVIACTAVVHAIKQKYPDSEVVFATSEKYAEILLNNPEVDKIVACKAPFEIIQIAYSNEFDKIYLPMFMTHEDTMWHQRAPWCEDGDRHNLVDFYASRCNDDIIVSDRKTFVSTPSVQDGALPEKFITLHTTSTFDGKDWDINNFTALVAKIKANFPDYKVVQVGLESDKQIQGTDLQFYNQPLTHVAAVLSKAKLHIDIDSGPAFIADSVGTKTICIMGSTWSRTSGPIGPNVTFVEPQRHCLNRLHTPCHTFCQLKPKCIDSISVDVVFDEVSKILK